VTGTIQTVLGPVGPGDLGSTLVHEHVVCGAGGVVRGMTGIGGGFAALLERGVAALVEARAEGVRTIVDATPFDLGRDVELLAEASRLSGVTIVAATGHWLLPSVLMQNRTVAELADQYIADLATGADSTSIRCGVIKVSSDEDVSPFEDRVIEAAAIAARATGAPIITHAKAVLRIGEQQADRFERLGLDPGRIVIGHADDTYELDYLTGIADRGFLIGMDRLPNGALVEYGGQTVEGRIDMIARLVELGYGDRIVVAHDDPIWAGVLSTEDQERHLAANPDGISFIARVVLPALRERGVTEDAIDAITVRNPARWLTGSEPTPTTLASTATVTTTPAAGR
jgi:phosphotriesterase-related protein